MACLIDIYLQRNANPVVWETFVEIIEDDILQVQSFGRPVRGRHSVSVYVRKSKDNAQKLLALKDRFNNLIRKGAYYELVLMNGKDLRYTLESPYLSDIGGIANCYEPDEPLVLKFLCSNYKADILKTCRTHHDYHNDPSYVTVAEISAE